MIGEGGTSLVYRAKDLRHRRDVALKVLQPNIAVAIGTDRFMREIEIAARLSHPHILPLLDSGSVQVGEMTCPFYVMPMVAGDTLRERLARGPLSPEDATRIAADIAAALDYAHRHGVVHRDIKPENVLFQDGLAVIADFGIARALDEAASTTSTKTGVLLGTPQYMSPEQVTGDPIDHRTDVYSLGCVLFEMLSGTPPFADKSLKSVLARRVAEPPPKLRTTGVQASPSVEILLQKAMATDPGDRFASAADFVAALRGTAVAGVGTARRLARAATIGLPLVLIATVVAVLLLRPPNRDTISTLAIRPLVNQSGDSATLYLSEGLEEAVADRLRMVPQLTVTAPTLVNQILAEEPSIDLQALGRRVRVGAILTWTLRRAGDSVRLRAELVGSDDGRIIWGETYARSVTDVVTVPGEIARTVSESLRLDVGAPQMGAIARRPTEVGAAYDAYLRGRRVWLRATPLGATGARANADSIVYYAERAIQLDPQYAGGHFLHAAYYIVAAMRGWRTPFSAMIDSGLAANRRAFELDSTMADTRIIQTVVAFYIRDQFELANELTAEAMRLNPDLASARFYRGLYLGEVERQLDSAIIQLRRAVDLEPQVQVSYLNSLGDIYNRAGRYDSAIGVLRQAIAVNSNVPGPHARLVRAFEALGNYDQAVKERLLSPDTTGASAIAKAYQQQGVEGYRRAVRIDLQRRVHVLLSQDPGAALDTVPPIREHRIAQLYARMGDTTKTVDWVIKAHARRPGRLAIVLGDPDFDFIRSDPRFRDLVQKAGLAGRLAGM